MIKTKKLGQTNRSILHLDQYTDGKKIIRKEYKVSPKIEQLLNI